MDIHIWYTLLSALVGGVMGARARLGEVIIEIPVYCKLLGVKFVDSLRVSIVLTFLKFVLSFLVYLFFDFIFPLYYVALVADTLNRYGA